MDEKAYNPVISGEVRWTDGGGYCYFHPKQLPFIFDITPETSRLLDRTLIALGRLDGKVSQMDADSRSILTKAFTMKESALSSAIEGTGTTISDLYMSERMDIRDANKLEDNKEVRNYLTSLQEGLSGLDSGSPLDERMIRGLHNTLLSGVRGSGKLPGMYRDTQVFVGGKDDTLETARYVPPPPEAVQWLMDSLLEYVGGGNENVLIRAALAHYQFETIHPFRDGNGRMGRLLIMLMLHREGVLMHPVLYPSEYFNSHRSEYIERLSAVRESDDIEGWIGFFAEALLSQAYQSSTLIDRLLGYRRELEDSKDGMNVVRTIDLLFRNPYVRAADVMEYAGVSAPTAGKILEQLESREVIREITGFKRNRVYVASRILQMLEGR